MKRRAAAWPVGFVVWMGLVACVAFGRPGIAAQPGQKTPSSPLGTAAALSEFQLHPDFRIEVEVIASMP